MHLCQWSWGPRVITARCRQPQQCISDGCIPAMLGTGRQLGVLVSGQGHPGERSEAQEQQEARVLPAVASRPGLWGGSRFASMRAGGRCAAGTRGPRKTQSLSLSSLKSRCRQRPLLHHAGCFVAEPWFSAERKHHLQKPWIYERGWPGAERIATGSSAHSLDLAFSCRICGMMARPKEPAGGRTLMPC